MTDDIDVISAALNGDRRAVLTDQLRRIDVEIIERLAINITTREALHELLREVRQDILHLEPHAGNPDDPTSRRDRLGLQKEYRILVRELSAEQRSCWMDTQALKLEARTIEKELLALQQRDRRLRDFA